MDTKIIMLVLEILAVVLLVAELIFHVKRKRGSIEKNIDTGPDILLPETEKEKEPETVLQKSPPAPLKKVVVTETEEISGEDLLEESAIYMQYGHHSQAATVLRWYVDLHPYNTLAVNQLLDAYYYLEDFSAYSQLLSSLGETNDPSKDRQWWENKVLTGLKKDPGNLELLTLAERWGLPIPNPGDTFDEPMTAAKALVLASRSNDPVYATTILRAAIQEEPLKLSLYAELLRITHNEKNVDGYIDGILLMFLSLGHGGNTIKDRMLKAGRNIGDSEWWNKIDSVKDNIDELKKLLIERGVSIPSKIFMG